MRPGKQWVAQYASGTHFEIRMAHAHGGLFGLLDVAVGLAPLALPPVRVFLGGAAMVAATLWLGSEALRLRQAARS